MYKEETITFDSGWKRIKLEFIDKIESNLENYDLNDKDDKLIKLKPNEYITYYKLVYDMCTQKDSNYSELLYNHLGQYLMDFIKNKMCNNLQQYKDDETELVELIYQYWIKYKSYINILKGIFSYLDRFYVQLALQPSVYEYAMAIFQKNVFDPYKSNIKKYLLDSLDLKRTGDEINNLHILVIIEMYSKLDSTLGLQYKEDLEPLILERCGSYYNKIAPIWLNDLSLLDYIYIIQYCIDDELEYCNKYLQKNTNELIYNTILTSLLYNQQDKINNKFDELYTLLDTYQIDSANQPLNTNIQDLKLIYKLTNKLSNINDHISNQLKQFILKNVKEHDTEHTIELYNKYLFLIQYSFNNNNYILNVYNSLFKGYVNNCEFINQLLSTLHEYMISNKCEEANIKKESNEPDTNGFDSKDKSDDYINVYYLIDDKNDFLCNYKMTLCYRMLTDKSDVDLETRVLNKLAHDDPSFNNLYKMIDDVKKSNKFYTRYVLNLNLDMNIDDNEILLDLDKNDPDSLLKHRRIIAICNTFWPISPNGYEEVVLDDLFLSELNQFQDYYKQNNKFKRFQYSFEYSPVEIVYDYKAKSYDGAYDTTTLEKKILCNMLQATLILLFNKADIVKTEQVLSTMNISREELIRIVESSGNLFAYDDYELTLNYEYLHKHDDFNLIDNVYKPLLSVRNHTTVSHRETLFESYYCIDSVIVRIMKKYKKLNQNNLLNIVNTQLNSLNIKMSFTEQLILERIKNLVTKEYIEQAEDQLIYVP